MTGNLTEFDVGSPTPRERVALLTRTEALWGPMIVTRGVAHRLCDMEALVARHRGDVVGGLTYRRCNDESIEVVTLHAFMTRQGVGSALMRSIAAQGRRVWLVTTNDNLSAQRFFAAVGGRLTAIHAGAIEAARCIKPTIPTTGIDGTPITDELEFAWTASDH